MFTCIFAMPRVRALLGFDVTYFYTDVIEAEIHNASLIAAYERFEKGFKTFECADDAVSMRIVDGNINITLPNCEFSITQIMLELIVTEIVSEHFAYVTPVTEINGASVFCLSAGNVYLIVDSKNGNTISAVNSNLRPIETATKDPNIVAWNSV